MSNQQSNNSGLEDKLKKACQSKIRFNTRREARKRARPLKLKVYTCILCNGFHMTSKISSNGRGIKDPLLIKLAQAKDKLL